MLPPVTNKADFLILLGIDPEEKLSDTVVLFLMFWGTPTLFSLAAAPLHETKVHSNAHLPTASLTLVTICSFV